MNEFEIEILKTKARKWDEYCLAQKGRSRKISPEKRKLNARKAVQARWKRNDSGIIGKGVE